MSDLSTAKGVVQGLLMGHGDHGGSWHGPAVWTLLQDIAPEDAAAHPIAGVKSIWEYLLHVNTWQQVVHRVIQTRTHIPETAVESWPAVTDTSPAAWNQTTDAFQQSATALLEALRALTEEDLNTKIQGADFPLKVVVHGVAHHSLYHGAQIALLKKALRNA